MLTLRFWKGKKGNLERSAEEIIGFYFANEQMKLSFPFKKKIGKSTETKNPVKNT